MSRQRSAGWAADPAGAWQRRQPPVVASDAARPAGRAPCHRDRPLRSWRERASLRVLLGRVGGRVGVRASTRRGGPRHLGGSQHGRQGLRRDCCCQAGPCRRSRPLRCRAAPARTMAAAAAHHGGTAEALSEQTRTHREVRVDTATTRPSGGSAGCNRGRFGTARCGRLDLEARPPLGAHPGRSGGGGGRAATGLSDRVRPCGAQPRGGRVGPVPRAIRITGTGRRPLLAWHAPPPGSRGS